MSTGEFFTNAWSWNPAVVVAGLAVLAFYVRVARLRLTRRTWFFAASLAVFLLTLVSPVETLAEHYLFSAHMFQHMTLLLIVPVLALLARPIASAQSPAPRPGPLWNRLLTFPLIPWLAGVGSMWVWHAPTLCDAATTSTAVRAIQTVSSLVLGGVFWWPIVGPAPARRMPALPGVLYLFTACIGCTLLGIVLTFSPVAVCSIYVHPMDPVGALPLIRDQWGLSPAIDQQIGGLMMWVPSCFIYLVAIMALLIRWYSAPGEPATTADHAPQPVPTRS